ncbi:MAG: sulfatase-like hydrolase/transferase [Candidatus Omnitrophota bacterium]
MNKKAYHQFFFALFPVLFLFSRNIGEGELRYADIILPSIVVLCFAFIFSGLFSAAARDRRKGAIITSVFLLLALSYGHGYSILNIFMYVKHRALLPVSAAFFFAVYYCVIRTKNDLERITVILNAIAVSMIVVPLISIAFYAADYGIQKNNCRAIKINEPLRGAAPVLPARDIYYIVIDSYVASSTLQEVYNYDNSVFTDFLKKKGFVIASNSRSNYSATFLSLASSLNMEYVNYLEGVIGQGNDRRILYGMIRESKLKDYLRERGYRILHFGMWWPPGKNEKSLGFDLLRDKCFSPFSLALMERSILNIFYDYYFASVIKNVTYNTFDAVAKVPGLKGPTFTFAYFYGMHAPFVFEADGQVIGSYAAVEYSKDKRKAARLFMGQLDFYNAMLARLIDDILSKSRIPPVIVLQSDHGLQFAECSQAGFKSCIQQRMRNFSAYYLPDNGSDLVYDSITPVNSFRLILKRYFNAEMELLNDRCFYSDKARPFVFTDVSDPGNE